MFFCLKNEQSRFFKWQAIVKKVFQNKKSNQKRILLKKNAKKFF